MNRKSARYALFRVQNETNGGAAALEHQWDVATKYSIIPLVQKLGGIGGFAEDWDIDTDLKPYPRLTSIHDDWKTETGRSSVDLPKTEAQRRKEQNATVPKSDPVEPIDVYLE